MPIMQVQCARGSSGIACIPCSQFLGGGGWLLGRTKLKGRGNMYGLGAGGGGGVEAGRAGIPCIEFVVV